MSKSRMIRVTDAMTSRRLLGPFFAGPSWATWRAVLKAAFCEPMSAAEVEAFRAVAERNPPSKPVPELDVIAGRGAGKDSIASCIATCIAVNFDPKGKLRPGEKAVVMCIAVDRTQAAIVYNYVRGYFEQIPAFAAMVKSIGAESIELHNGVVIEVHTNSYRSVRGRSIICAIFDEVAFWRSEDSATPDVEVAGAVAPGLARVAGSMMILISSAHKRSGLLYQRWKDHYGRDDDDVLVVRGTTLQFNPRFDAKVIARQLESDPQLYNAEYNSQWRDDLATFVSRELIEAAVDDNVLVRPRVPNVHYHCMIDPSGGVGDSMTLAISHREKDKDLVILDCLVERAAPFQAASVVKEFAAVMKEYGLSSCTSDRYAASWVQQAFAAHGIKLVHSTRDRSEIYMDVLPLFTSGKARLLDHKRLISQFAGLERRTTSTRDKIDHASGGHDDVCNSAAGSLVLANDRRNEIASAAPVLITASEALAPHLGHGGGRFAALGGATPPWNDDDGGRPW
jgi:hypothetical protein